MRTAAILLGLAMALGTVIGLTGCLPMQQADEYIYRRATAAGPDVDVGPPPPIVELIASALAVAGYAGLATWIHRTGKTNRKHATAQDTTLSELLTRLVAIETYIKARKNPGS